MCIQNCCQKEFTPRTKRVGSYKTVNSYTHAPSLEQIITIIIFAIQLALHSVFIVPPLDDIKKQILWVFLGFHYALFLIIAYDYIQLTINDPVDRLVLNKQVPEHVREEELVLCILCDSQVRGTSHHCFRCDRCTEQFDHHCKFLNNCIGGQNYEFFFRLLSIYTLYNFNVIGQSIWVMQQSFSSPDIALKGNQWGAITLLILTLLVLVTVGGLLGFHCYISICEITTTLQYNYPQKKNRAVSSGGRLTNVNIFQPPASAQRLSSPI